MEFEQKDVITALTAVAVIILIRQNRKLKRLTNCLDRMVDIVRDHIDDHYQMHVDKVFNNIVDNEK